MSRTRTRPAVMPLLAPALAMLALACTDERAPRSFVQPNALKKADLEGTWYYLQTVLDAPPTATAVVPGVSTDLMKIRFDVQEGVLYARRAYEHILGSEDAKTKNPGGYLGQPLAAWKIAKHFDIIRDYNATTGEETNRIIESEERTWTEREFVRVDWSKNLVNNYAGLVLGDDVSIEPVSYWESDPGKPEAIHVERAAGGDAEFAPGEANYFDLTNKLVLTPSERTLCFGQGAQNCFRVPACWLRQNLADCADAVVKLRHAFAKVSPKHDYEPRKWDGKQMELFGLWDVGLSRLSYDRQYGVTNSGIARTVARFNLWKKSYRPDGSKIPHAERELRTIPYYADASGLEFPPDLHAAGGEVVDQWNAAVAGAAKAVTGRAPEQRIFVWCHNPVKLAADGKGPADAPACAAGLTPEADATGKPRRDGRGDPILRARQGDPRRSRIFWVNQFQSSGPLGYGPPIFDPETGETISGQAYIYGAALDAYAARSRDLVRLVAGQLPAGDFIKGVNVKDWVDKNRRAAGAGAAGPTLTAAEVKARLSAMDFSWGEGLAPDVQVDPSSPQAFARTFRARQDALHKTGVFGRAQADLGEVRRSRAIGTAIEAMMVTPDLLAAAGGRPTGAQWSALSEADKARVSPLRAQLVEKLDEERKRRLTALGFDFADIADDNLAQRAIKLARAAGGGRALDPEKLWTDIRRDVFVALALHEMGHNVGLRHNFRASYDALNYFPDYWKLRVAGAGARQRFAGIDPATGEALGVPYRGDDCSAGRLRPRYVDCPGGALSVEEAAGQIQEYQYSSVMDYGSDFNSDLNGLGHYDRAAMKFAYAGDGYVEVFTRARTTNQAALARLASLQVFSGTYGFPSPINLGASTLQGIAYQTYPDLFSDGAAAIEAREDVPYSEIEPLSAGFPLLVDRRTKGQAAALRPMVPYYFCGDEFVGNLTCQRWDAGADAFEQARDLISRYENYYLLNNFKRDRYTFQTSGSYRSTIVGRYLMPLRQQMTWYTLYRTVFAGSADPGSPSALFGSESGWGNFTVAVTEGFDLLGRIITRPDVGTYTLVPAERSPEAPVEHFRQVSEDFTAEPREDRPVVGLGDGRFTASTWDFDGCGYYWADECQSRIGYFLDKVFALQMLTDSQAYFTGRDTSTDVRLYSIGYILPFKNQLMEKMGALLAGDLRSIAPSISADGRRVEGTSWTLDDASPARGRLVDPAIGFTLQLYASVYGLSGFSSTFDQSFLDASRIFVVGNGEAPVPDRDLLAGGGVAGPAATFDPDEMVSAAAPGQRSWFLWTDRASGKTYAARAFPRAAHEGAKAPYRVDVGVRMLQMARTLEADVATACAPTGNPSVCRVKTRAFDHYRQNLNIMRALHTIFADAPF